MSNDPVERIIAEALDAEGYEYTTDHDSKQRLDFYVPALEIYIECKRFACARLADQIGNRDNVIVVVGLNGARALAKLIKGE